MTHNTNFSDDVLRLNPELCAATDAAQDAKPSKYHARRAEANGEQFDSGAECSRYQMLLLQERGGDIRNLKRQPRFDLIVNGVNVGYYKADYEYDLVATGAHIVEDCKGVRTPVYRLKRKLMKALYNIDILETDRDGVPFT